MGAASVSEYVASLNEEQRRHISAFIDFMNGTYPQLTIKISFSMPRWLVGKKMNEGYVAVSAAKSHFSVHFSDEAFLNRLAESLPACKKGKRCINIQYGDESSLRAVEELSLIHILHPEDQRRQQDDAELLRKPPVRQRLL